MTVLRSRTIAPVIKDNKSPFTEGKLEKPVNRIEPNTPTQTHEPQPHDNPTPSPDSEISSLSVSKPGPIRRSARLAAVSGAGSNGMVLGVVTNSERSNLDGSVTGGGKENGVLEGGSRVRVRGKRKLEVELGGFEGSGDKGSLCMRSGKSVVKIGVEGKKSRSDGSGSSGSVRVETRVIGIGMERMKSCNDGSGSSRGSVEEMGVGRIGMEGKNSCSNSSGSSSVSMEEEMCRKEGLIRIGSVPSSGKERGKGVLIGTEEKNICSNGSESSNASIEEMMHGEEGLTRIGRALLSMKEKGKGVLIENEMKAESGGVRGKRKYGMEEKGKGKAATNTDVLGDNDSSDSVGSGQLVHEKVADDSSSDEEPSVRERQRDYMRGYMKRIAKENAKRFAHFNPEDEELYDPWASRSRRNVEPSPEMAEPEPQPEIEDWPGPFSTAMKIIRDRELKRRSVSSLEKHSKPKPVIWVPKQSKEKNLRNRVVPLLQDLCLKVLAANAEAISSLDGIPDDIKHKLSTFLCDTRKMSCHVFNLLVQGSQTEIRVKNCSGLAEEELASSFSQCDMSSLKVLQLDMCGRCLTDPVLCSSSTFVANGLPALSALSITGGCRLSDVGLTALVSSAPALRSVNLSQCSLLTSRSIEALAESLGSGLKELYINDCQSIDPALILPSLEKLESLEVLSIGGFQSLSDDFMRNFIAKRGCNMKELVFSDCVNLTDASLKAIAQKCAGLRALNLVNLTKLTDSAIGYLANGCPEIQKLTLCRNKFSDEAVAAFVEASGEQLEELSLNNVQMVGRNTAVSIAKRAKKLHTLDLSWCRNMTDEAMGLIVDSCPSLKELRVFGCSQITNVFLHGHSNMEVRIVGLKMSPLLESCRSSDPLSYL